MDFAPGQGKKPRISRGSDSNLIWFFHKTLAVAVAALEDEWRGAPALQQSLRRRQAAAKPDKHEAQLEHGFNRHGLKNRYAFKVPHRFLP